MFEFSDYMWALIIEESEVHVRVHHFNSGVHTMIHSYHSIETSAVHVYMYMYMHEKKPKCMYSFTHTSPTKSEVVKGTYC